MRLKLTLLSHLIAELGISRLSAMGTTFWAQLIDGFWVDPISRKIPFFFFN